MFGISTDFPHFPLSSPTRTIYVVSDSQLVEMKREQMKEELNGLHNQRITLDRAYEQRKEALDKRVQELTAEVAAITPVKELS